MKRSDINEILGHTRQFFSMHGVHLPPFASFPPTKWQQLDQAAWQEVFDLRLGWDVTAQQLCHPGPDAFHPAQRLPQRRAL